MDSTKIKELWEKAWSAETHATAHAAKRIASAKSSELTPVKIDFTDMYGYFQGRHGRYETFLDQCSCADFTRASLPCKHIYRLAIELGVLEEKVTNDKTAIPTPRTEQISLNDTIDLVEKLSKEAQKKLLIISGSKEPHLRFQYKYHNMAELLISELVVEIEPETPQIIWGRKDEITDLLNNFGIPHNQKAKKEELQKICMEHIPEKAKEKFDRWVEVMVSPDYNRRKIHYYLHRKLDFSLFWNPETGVTEKTPLLETTLPDDDVTGQLTQRGYYKKKQ